MSILYVIATPIGNLGDISCRAIALLKSVDFIAAEDTRHSRKLLQHYQISNSLVSYHEHNEKVCTEKIISALHSGKTVALISDAGTPLVSDPGYYLLKRIHAEKLTVVPIPGACAAIAALSVSGLACDKFMFEGFLPAARAARNDKLNQLVYQARTMIFYEAPHRIADTLYDMMKIFGPVRLAVLARELTKTHETIHQAALKDLYEFVLNNAHQSRGECVLIVSGLPDDAQHDEEFETAKKMMALLLPEMPLKKAVKITAEILPVSKNLLYSEALKIQLLYQQNKSG